MPCPLHSGGGVPCHVSALGWLARQAGENAYTDDRLFFRAGVLGLLSP